MSEHLKSPASTSESEQTKQQAKMNAIRSSLQKLEEEEEEEMLQQRIAANIQLAKEKKSVSGTVCSKTTATRQTSCPKTKKTYQTANPAGSLSKAGRWVR